MALKDRIMADLKQAMLAKDEVTRDALRMVKTEMINREIELGKELAPEDEIAVLKKAIKSRHESIEQYEQSGRSDAAARERKEVETIEQYLPKQLSEQELRAAIESIVGELGLSGKKDMGRVMQELKSRHAGAFDGKSASQVAQQVLG